MELSVVLSRPLISDIIKGFFAVRKAVISPTYIYSTNTTDIHFFVYFAKPKYFVFKVIS
jgi:hypothetical protein